MKNYEIPETQDDIIALDAKAALRISKANSREEFESILEKIKLAAEKGETQIKLHYQKDGVSRLLIDAGYIVEDITVDGIMPNQRISTIIKW